MGETVPFLLGLVPRDDQAAGSPCAAAFPEDAPVPPAMHSNGRDSMGGSSSDSPLSTSHLTPLSRSHELSDRWKMDVGDLTMLET